MSQHQENMEEAVEGYLSSSKLEFQRLVNPWLQEGTRRRENREKKLKRKSGRINLLSFISIQYNSSISFHIDNYKTYTNTISFYKIPSFPLQSNSQI
jgi:hypothetical protein